MSVLDPDGALVAKLKSLSPLSLTAGALVLDGTNVFKGKVRPARSEVQEQAIFIQELPGRKPDRYLGQPETFKYFLCVVTVRSNPADYSGGQELARVILKICSGMALTGYEDTKTLQSGPEQFLEDGDRRFFFRFGVELWANDSP